MPFKRKVGKRPYRKKPHYKRKPKTNAPGYRTALTASNSDPRSSRSLFPPRLRIGLRWVKTYSVAAGTTDIPNIQHFNLTGLYDPEVAVSASLAPYGFTEIMSHYDSYSVVGAKAVMTFVHNTGNPMCVGTITTPGTVTTTYDTNDEFITDPRSRYGFISPNKPQKTCVVKYSRKKTFDATNQHSLKGSISTNPTEGYYVSTFSNNMGPGEAQAPYTLLVRIEYFAEFAEPLNVVKT